jgi:ribosomal protein L34E
MPATKTPADYKYVRSYDADTHTLMCSNCGGQTMGGVATGETRERSDGTPCKHEYKYKSLGRCYHGYTCKHCGYGYTIDSGD